MHRLSFTFLREYCARVNTGEQLPSLCRSRAIQTQFDKYRDAHGFELMHPVIENKLQTQSYIMAQAQFPFHLEHDILQYECWTKKSYCIEKARQQLSCLFMTNHIAILRETACKTPFALFHVFLKDVDPYFHSKPFVHSKPFIS